MNSSLAQSDYFKTKRSLRIISAILLVQYLFPNAFMWLFLTLEFFLQFMIFEMVYCIPFAIAGLFGLLISMTNNPMDLKILLGIFICFFAYCIVGALIFLALCIWLIIEKATSSGNWDESHDDDTGLGRGIALLFLILFFFATAYFIFAIWMGWRGIKTSRYLRNLLLLRESPEGNQQSLNLVNLTDYRYPENYQPQLNAGYPHLIDTPPLR